VTGCHGEETLPLLKDMRLPERLFQTFGMTHDHSVTTPLGLETQRLLRGVSPEGSARALEAGAITPAPLYIPRMCSAV
jgi:hypothetical protein